MFLVGQERRLKKFSKQIFLFDGGITINEEEVIRLFLKNGYQISKNALPLILTDPEKVILGISELKPRPFIITEKHVKKIFELSKKPEVEVKKIKEYQISPKQIRIEDYVKHFQTRYEKIRKILLKRMDKEKLISINKITPRIPTFSLIGVVRQKKENNLLLEDPSGEILISFDDVMKPKLDEVNLDDVIGVSCKKIRENLFAKNIYFPGVPSSRDINKTEEEIKIAFLYNPSLLDEKQQKELHKLLVSDESLSSVFVFTDKLNKQVIFPNLNLIKILKESPPTLFQIDKIRILVLQKNFFGSSTNKDPVNFIISLLRRRILVGAFNPQTHIGSNNFVLEYIPDIIISDFYGGLYKNYKGASIILNSDPTKFFLVNLKTREILKKSIES